LVKTFYGLKQFLWVWNHKFNNFFTIHHFIPSIANPCVYVSSIDPFLNSLHICQWRCNITIDEIVHILNEMKGMFNIIEGHLRYMLVCISRIIDWPTQFTFININTSKRFWSGLAFRMQHQSY
jgi:hypothetical protein